MEQRVIFVLPLFLALTAALPSSSSKVYRSDYEYNGRTDAFYKLHIESERATRARQMCEVEGAQLMVPASLQDIMQLHAMFKRFPDLGQYVWVGYDGQDHESAEERPIIELDPAESNERWPAEECDVVTRKGEIETYPCYRTLPFICKVEAKDAPYDAQCDVYGRDYVRPNQSDAQTTKSCYKIPRITYSWNQAYSECRAEGAHLVVIKSEAEALTVKELLNRTPAVDGARTSWFFFAGFRANRPTDGTPRVFKTVFNQTLDEAGYNKWSENEPNNYMDSEYCGSIFKNDGKFNDLDCSHEYAFVCEKEIHV